MKSEYKPEDFQAIYSMGLGVMAFKGTGSFFMCDPPVQDTDMDILILVPNLGDAYDKLLTLDPEKYQVTQGEYELGEFIPVRYGKYNFLIVGDKAVFDKWCKATEVCSLLNATDKAVRVFIFKMVVDGYSWKDAMLYSQERFFYSEPTTQAHALDPFL